MFDTNNNKIKITCSICNTKYSMKKSLLSRTPLQFACKKCGSNIVLINKLSPNYSDSYIARPSTSKMGNDYRKSIKTIVLIVLGVFFIVTLMLYFLFSYFKNSTPYRIVEDFLKNSPEIKEVVGKNVKLSIIPNNISIRESNLNGNAEITTKVQGDVGSTKIYCYLEKSDGIWRIIELKYIDQNGVTRTIIFDYKNNHIQKDVQKNYIKKAYSLYKNKKYNEAIEELNIASKNLPNDPEVYYLRGRCFLFLKDYNNAIKDFKKAIGINPDHIESLKNLGWLYSEKKDYKTSLKYLNKVIGLGNSDGWTYYTRARIYYKTGNIKQAKEDLKIACEIGYKDACKFYKKF